MDSFIRRENIRLYQKRLAETIDEEKRKTILRLLAEEQAKQDLSIRKP